MAKKIEKNQKPKRINKVPEKNRSVNKNRNLSKRTTKPGLFQKFFYKKVPTTVQDTIKYQRICEDGICQIDEKTYSKTINFKDINYVLAKDEDQAKIFGDYSMFLNYFDSSIDFQLTFLNRIGQISTEHSINIEPQNDNFNDIRIEYKSMIEEQMKKGNNGLVKDKYITFSVVSNNMQQAKQRLERIEIDLLNKFKTLGVSASPLNGKERLELLYRVMNTDKPYYPLNFDWNNFKKSGEHTKDYIAPSSMIFDKNNYRLGDTWCETVYFNLTAPEIPDTILSDLLEMNSDLVVTMHARSVDQLEAIRKVNQKLTDLRAVKIDQQKKASMQGYDPNIISATLEKNTEDTEEFLNMLQDRNERMFMVTISITCSAKTKKELDNSVFAIKGVIQKHNCTMRKLDYLQEDAFVSMLPIGKNYLTVKRAMTTTALAIFIPFTTQELFYPGGTYYGLNAVSNNIILANRKALQNPNGLILGVPGSGKSFSAKREITDTFLRSQDDILICDPEAEYRPLVEALGGQVINISINSKNYINPLDINANYGGSDAKGLQEAISVKSDFIISLMDLIAGGKFGLSAVEKSVVDRSVRNIYRKFMENPIEENMPLLEDLYTELNSQREEDSKRLATALELYVKGSLKVFNNHTNVDLNNRIVCYDIKDLGDALRKIGMLIVQDNVWEKVSRNRFSGSGRSTWYYIDEFHLLLAEEQTASYSLEFWKRFRKWGGVPTGITQNVKDFLGAKGKESIFDNSEFIYLLNQAPGDKEILAKKLNISEQQLSFITNSEQGAGLLKFSNTIIPFRDRFPKETKLYKLMTTKPNEQE